MKPSFPSSPPRELRSRNGFTLTEIMIAMFGLSIMTMIFLSVYLDTSEIAFVSDERNQINRDIRTVTAELSQHARSSNYFVLYRSFAAADRDGENDRLLEGNAGDFLVLVFQGEVDTVNLIATRPTTRIIGYYRAPNTSGDGESGPVRKFDVAIAEADQGKPLETLLPAATAIDSYPQVIELSEGLADGRLFFNLWGRSVMVNGKILHGNAAKRVTDTYNFTVSPRGQQG